MKTKGNKKHTESTGWEKGNFFRLALKWLGWTICGLVVLIGLGLASIQTQVVKEKLTVWIEEAISSDDRQVDLKGLQGFIPINFGFEKISLKNQKGTLGEVDEAKISWSPSSILLGKIKINNLSAKSVHIQNLPIKEEEPQPETESRLPSWPGFLNIDLNRIQVAKILLGPEVLGKKAAFTLLGKGYFYSSQDFSGSLDIEQLEPQGFKMNSKILRSQKNLEVDIKLQEEKGGFLTSRLVKGLKTPLALSVQGQGPVSDWNGKLDFWSAGDKLVDSQIMISVNKKKIGLSLQGQARPQSYLPDKMKELFQDEQKAFFLVKTLFERESSVFSLEQVRITGDQFALEGWGLIDTKQKQVDGKLTLNVPELKEIAPLIKTKIEGGGRIDLDIQGIIERPNIKCVIKGQDLEFQGLETKEAQLVFSLPEVGWKEKEDLLLTIQGQGESQPILLDGRSLLTGDLEMKYVAQIGSSGLINIHELQLNTEKERLKLAGQIKADGQTQGRLVTEISQFENLPYLQGSGMSGSVKAEAELSGNLNKPLIVSSIKADFKDLAGFPPNIQEILGAKVNLSSVFKYQGSDVLNLESFDLKGQKLNLLANGQTDLKNRELDLFWQLDGPRLQDLDWAKKNKVKGRLKAKGKVSGLWSELGTDSQITISQLESEILKPTAVYLGLQADKLNSGPAGTLAVLAKGRRHQVRGQINFDFPESRVRIKDLDFELPKGIVKGQASWDLKKSKSGQADLFLKSDSLSWINDFMKFNVQGVLNLRANVLDSKEGLQVKASGQVASLACDYLKIQKGVLDLDMTNLARLDGSLKLTGSNIRSDMVQIRDLKLEGQGRSGRMDLDLWAKGHRIREFNLSTSGQLQVDHKLKRLSLEKGTGHFGELSFSWGKPLWFQQEAGKAELSVPGLSLGSGQVKARGKIQGDQITGLLQVQEVEVSHLPYLTSRGLAGNLQGQMDLSGYLNDPKMNLEMRLQDVQIRSGSRVDLDPIDLRINSVFKDQILKVEFHSQDTDQLQLKADMDLPARIRLKPFSFDQTYKMQGSLLCSFDLDLINSIVPLVDRRVTGNLKSRLNISGMLTDPDLSGEINLQNGRYEDAKSGLILDKIRAETLLQGKKILISQLQATDGRDGSITGQGSLAWLQEDDLSFDLSIKADQAKLIRLDFASGQVSGNVRLKGSNQGAIIKGDLKIFPLEVSIPEPGPPGTSGLIIKETGLKRKGPDQKSRSQRNTGFWAKSQLDLEVELPGGIFLRGRGLDSEWQGQLQVTGPATAPKVNGHLEKVRGHMNILTKRFKLTEGRITFLNQFPPLPLLEIIAEHQAKDITVYLNLNGPVTELGIELDSKPSYPRDEILSRLLFNRELDSITPLQAVKLALAIRTLTTGGGRGIMDKARSLLGFDELELKSSQQDSGTMVGVGKYLNENIYFKVEKGLAEESGQVVVDIELTPKFSLETETGADSQGLDFKWSYRY